MDPARLLASGRGLLRQAQLHGKLAQVEWQEEKERLLQVLMIGLLGYASLLCALLSGGGLVLAAFWDTGYRWPVFFALVVGYSTGAVLAWRKLEALVALGEQAFAASREELSADAALLAGPP